MCFRQEFLNRLRTFPHQHIESSFSRELFALHDANAIKDALRNLQHSEALREHNIQGVVNIKMGNIISKKETFIKP